MPQLTLPEIKLSELGDRLHDATDDLPEEVRERLSGAGERIADAAERASHAGDRLGSDVSERLSDLRWPGLVLPAALRAMPGVLAPKLDLPNVDLSKVDLRRDLPHVDTRDLRRAISRLEIPQVTVGKPKAGPPVLPLVILAAVGGAFIGWWLATSSFAAGRLRALAHRAQARLGPVSDSDEGVEERTEDFWADERGWQTNQTPRGAHAEGEHDTAFSVPPAGPGASISGEDGSVRGGTTAADTAGDGAGDLTVLDEALPADWPASDEGAGEGSERGAAAGSAWAEGTGGTGFEPGPNR